MVRSGAAGVGGDNSIICVAFGGLRGAGVMERVFSAGDNKMDPSPCKPVGVNFCANSGHRGIMGGCRLLYSYINVSADRLILDQRARAGGIGVISRDRYNMKCAERSFRSVSKLVAGQPGITLIARCTSYAPLVFYSPGGGMVTASRSN